MIFKTNKCSLVKGIILLVILSAASVIFSSCIFFEDPIGECELLSVYTKDVEDVHYLHATLKISNTCNKNIYNSTVSIEGRTNLRPYYKTVSLDITIAPDDTIYIPIEMDFTQKNTETPKETWNTSSLIILSQSWK